MCYSVSVNIYRSISGWMSWVWRISMWLFVSHGLTELQFTVTSYWAGLMLTIMVSETMWLITVYLICQRNGTKFTILIYIHWSSKMTHLNRTQSTPGTGCGELTSMDVYCTIVSKAGAKSGEQHTHLSRKSAFVPRLGSRTDPLLLLREDSTLRVYTAWYISYPLSLLPSHFQASTFSNYYDPTSLCLARKTRYPMDIRKSIRKAIQQTQFSKFP